MSYSPRVVSTQLTPEETTLLEELVAMRGGNRSDALRFAVRQAHATSVAMGWLA